MVVSISTTSKSEMYVSYILCGIVFLTAMAVPSCSLHVRFLVCVVARNFERLILCYSMSAD